MSPLLNSLNLPHKSIRQFIIREMGELIYLACLIDYMGSMRNGCMSDYYYRIKLRVCMKML